MSSQKEVAETPKRSHVAVKNSKKKKVSVSDRGGRREGGRAGNLKFSNYLGLSTVKLFFNVYFNVFSKHETLKTAECHVICYLDVL